MLSTQRKCGGGHSREQARQFPDPTLQSSVIQCQTARRLPQRHYHCSEGAHVSCESSEELARGWSRHRGRSGQTELVAQMLIAIVAVGRFATVSVCDSIRIVRDSKYAAWRRKATNSGSPLRGPPRLGSLCTTSSVRTCKERLTPRAGKRDFSSTYCLRPPPNPLTASTMRTSLWQM